MKKLLRKTLGIVLAGVMTFGALGVIAFAGDIVPNTITVSGTGVVKVKPDTADISFSVETKGKTNSEAQAENAKVTDSVKKALKNFGINEENIITSGYSVYPDYYYDSDTKEDKITGRSKGVMAIAIATAKVKAVTILCFEKLSINTTGITISINLINKRLILSIPFWKAVFGFWGAIDLTIFPK